MAGIRISVMINVGTATVGAVVGAGGDWNTDYLFSGKGESRSKKDALWK